MDYKELMSKAAKARESAYAPYSHFRVGAALVAKNGNVYLGCNIENSAYSPSVCAERVAFFKAVSEGIKEFDAIAIVGGKEGGTSALCAPCGVCRQVMTEFCDKDFKIVLGTPEKFEIHTLEGLLPLAFSKDGVK